MVYLSMGGGVAGAVVVVLVSPDYQSTQRDGKLLSLEIGHVSDWLRHFQS